MSLLSKEVKWQFDINCTTVWYKLYPTWKVHCKIALVRDGLSTVAGSTQSVVWKDQALAIFPALYLLGNLEDPAAIWKKLSASQISLGLLRRSCSPQN